MLLFCGFLNFFFLKVFIGMCLDLDPVFICNVTDNSSRRTSRASLISSSTRLRLLYTVWPPGVLPLRLKRVSWQRIWTPPLYFSASFFILYVHINLFPK
ncbi:hypothetical protein DPEC_G00196550 [Dallia pectoralis]|uniref:Uncharacterized protein n=1 Tax=Dallia pectoralis TaxID=75939 RepID=A0ACC2G7P2_DALPE|nr:hypothetical protein DPEC_G00196550 [Dallia pectoralis]